MIREPNEKEIIQYIVDSFAFLLRKPGRKQEFNNLQYAEAIKGYCDLSNPRTRYCYELCLKKSFTVKI